jgi:hypothetical protein
MEERMAHALKPWRLVSILALSVGLLTISATAARAETGAYWEIGLTKEIKNFSPELNAEAEFHSVLLTKVGLAKVEISCIWIRLPFMEPREVGGVTGRIHYEGCTTKLNGNAANACVPHSPGATNGLIETNVLKGLIRLHTGGVPLLEILPQFGESFVTLVLGKAAPEKNECAIGEKFDIKGKAFVEDAQGEGAVNKITHLVEEGPLSALLFGANPATIDGSARVFLRGEFEGDPWSGHPA